MQLVVGFSGPRASTSYIQLSHRRDAVAYAIAGLAKIREANLDLLGRDALTTEIEGTMRAWVEETLYQGAYLREYHLWEKDCKEYFLAMATRNSASWVAKPKGRTPFTKHIEEALRSYNVCIPTEILEDIDAIRERTNVMKHDPGLSVEHFVTEDDYSQAMNALEGFWLLLTKHELHRL